MRKSIIEDWIRASLFGLVIVILFCGCNPEELISARLYIQQKNWGKAEEYLLRASLREPENSEIPFLYGRMYMKQNKRDKMNAAFEESLAIDNKFAREIEKIREVYLFNASLELERYEKMFEQSLISKEAYEAKKKQLLGL